MSMIDPKGSRPEALARFGQSARNKTSKSDKPGLEADRQVLRESVMQRNEDARYAIDKLPRRITKN